MADNIGQRTGVALGVLMASSTMVTGIVSFSRQARRRAWYAPMAAFYQARKEDMVVVDMVRLLPRTPRYPAN